MKSNCKKIIGFLMALALFVECTGIKDSSLASAKTKYAENQVVSFNILKVGDKETLQGDGSQVNDAAYCNKSKLTKKLLKVRGRVLVSTYDKKKKKWIDGDIGKKLNWYKFSLASNIKYYKFNYTIDDWGDEKAFDKISFKKAKSICAHPAPDTYWELYFNKKGLVSEIYIKEL